jgi:hypothetical protein
VYKIDGSNFMVEDKFRLSSGGRAFQQGGIGDIIRQTTQKSFFGTQT